MRQVPEIFIILISLLLKNVDLIQFPVPRRLLRVKQICEISNGR